MHEFMRKLWTNFSRPLCTNLSTKFARIRTNSYEFFARKIGYVTNGLYCINASAPHKF